MNPNHDEKGRFASGPGGVKIRLNDKVTDKAGRVYKVHALSRDVNGPIGVLPLGEEPRFGRTGDNTKPLSPRSITSLNNKPIEISGRVADDVPHAKFGGMSRNDLRAIMKANAGPGYKAGAYKGYDRDDRSSRRNNPR